MAFDETPVYLSDIAAGDEGTPNLMSSQYVQRAVLASRPAQGNKGVAFIASDDADGERLYWDDGSSWVDVGLIGGPLKAWCQITSGGALSSPDFNVDTVTDSGVGNRLVNWLTDFATSVYAIAIAADADISTNNINSNEVTSYAVGSVRIKHFTGTGGDTASDQQLAVIATGNQ